jgi:hypothetical protein
MPILKDMASISDLAKFFIMLLLYTGYMTWWAASVSHDIEENSEHIKQHQESDLIFNRQTLILAETVHNLQEEVKQLKIGDRESAKVHAKCGTIMDIIIQRLEKLEK